MADVTGAAVWLAGTARGGCAATRGGDPEAALHAVRGLVADHVLMSEVLALCDAAQAHFAGRGDPAGAAWMDAFSIELLRRIGEYLEVRPAR